MQAKDVEGDFSDSAQPHSALAAELFAVLYAATGEFMVVGEDGVAAPAEEEAA